MNTQEQIPENEVLNMTKIKVGNRFGWLTVVKRDENPQNSGHYLWECICKCGKVTHTSTRNLKWGISKSCGCLNRFLKKKDINLEEAKNLYKEGFNQKEVGQKLGVSQNLIMRRFRDLGFKCRPCRKNGPRENGAHWKGNNAGYVAFHYRIIALKGRPKKCEVCSTYDPLKNYDWANLTGHYEDPNDYKRMCRSCHAKYDNKILNCKKGDKK